MIVKNLFLLTATGDQLWFDHTVQQSIPLAARFLADQIARHFLDSGQYFADLVEYSPGFPELIGKYFLFDLALLVLLEWDAEVLFVLQKLA